MSKAPKPLSLLQQARQGVGNRLRRLDGALVEALRQGMMHMFGGGQRRSKRWLQAQLAASPQRCAGRVSGCSSVQA